MGIGVLIGDKHFRHGDLVGDRSEPVAGNDPHIIKDRALPRIEAQMESPVLPVDLAPRNGKIDPILLRNADGL